MPLEPLGHFQSPWRTSRCVVFIRSLLHNLGSVEGVDWGDRSVPGGPFCGTKTTSALRDLVASAFAESSIGLGELAMKIENHWQLS